MTTRTGAFQDSVVPENTTVTITGPAHLVGAVEGALAGGWVGPRFELHATADGPVEAIEVRGFLPYERAGGVRFSVTANGQALSRVEMNKGRFAWRVPCATVPSEPITLTIAAERAYVPAASGSPDRRQLGFVLEEIVFLPAAVPSQVPEHSSVSKTVDAAPRGSLEQERGPGKRGRKRSNQPVAGPNPLVHVGLAKTATTFLQRTVYPNITGIHYLGKNTEDDALRRAGAAIVRLHSLSYREESVVAAFAPHLTMAREQGRRPLYSEEDLSVFKFMDPETCARRMRTVLGPYDVLLVARDPFTWVQSQYHFLLSTLHPGTFSGIDAWLRDQFRVVGIGSAVSEINYCRTLEVHHQISGGRAHLLPYELLAQDPTAFAERLAEVIGGDRREIAKLVSSPRAPGEHKGRISQTEANYLQECRHVESGAYATFVARMAEYASLPGAEPDADALRAMDELAHSRERDFQRWREPISVLRRSLRRVLEVGPAATEEIAPELARMLDRAGRQQLNEAKVKFGMDFRRLGVSYHCDA